MVGMGDAEITPEMVAEHRRRARLEPATGLPALATCLMRLGRQVGATNPAAGLPHFEEGAGIFRDLAAGGGEHAARAGRAVAALGRQYTYAHADAPALAARQEAVALARQAGGADQRLLMDLAHGLAEAGRFEEAVAVQAEIAELDRGGAAGSLLWSLLTLAILLDQAGRVDESLATEREALAVVRADGSPEVSAIWTAGSALRFAAAGRPQEARGLLEEAAAGCGRLPAAGSTVNFGYHLAVQSAHFARSGAGDETGRAVLGVALHFWSFSLREEFRIGLAAVDEAVEAAAADLPAQADDPDRLAAFGTLLRRRNVRVSVLHDANHQIRAELVPGLARGVAVERRLLAADPGRGAARLVRALTDQAMLHLVDGANAAAAAALDEACGLIVR
jgi:tetratricopeptide (TPR) repeat protein